MSDPEGRTAQAVIDQITAKSSPSPFELDELQAASSIIRSAQKRGGEGAAEAGGQ
jgi:hypothetical protein